MTPPNVGPPPSAPPAKAPAIDQDAAKKKRPWPVRVLAWGTPVIAAALLVNYTVPGANRVTAASVCLLRYATAAHAIRPASSAWVPYGSTQISDTASSVAVRPNPAMGAADEWFGATLPVTTSCDYRIEFQATLVGPLYRAPGSGYGYAIGARSSVDNGVPDGTTIQYDPPFGGLRTVDVPGNVNKPGYNPWPVTGIGAGQSHRWVIAVNGDSMKVSLDGRAYPATVNLDTGHGNAVIVRVWNAKVIIAGLSIEKLPPHF